MLIKIRGRIAEGTDLFGAVDDNAADLVDVVGSVPTTTLAASAGACRFCSQIRQIPYAISR